MKKFVVFVAACFLACSFLLTAQTASAATGNGTTAWEQHIPGYTFSFSNGDMTGYQFGLFDIGNPVDYVLILDENVYSAAITEGSFDSESIDVTYYTSSGPNSVNFSDFSGLGLYLYVIGSGDLIVNYDYTEYVPNSGNFTIDFGDTIPTITLANAVPVATPVPTSLLLLGSGLVGLFGLRRNQSMS